MTLREVSDELRTGKSMVARLSGRRAARRRAIGNARRRLDSIWKAARIAARSCRAYLALSSLMSQVQRPAPPADLALRIRVAAAQRLAERPWLHYVRRARIAPN